MKRKSLFIISITISLAGLFVSRPVSALDYEAELWTLADMEEASAASFAEATALCADSDQPNCWSEYLRQRKKRGGFYRAMSNFESRKLIITSVNPTTRKIKVIYYNHARRWQYSYSPKDPAEPKSLYIGRTTYTSTDRSPWREMRMIISEGTTSPEIHIAFRWEAANNDGIALIPGVEHEFDLEDISLDPEIYNIFYYALDDSLGGQDDVNYLNSCLDNYQEGTECRLFYTQSNPTYIAITPTSQPDSTEEGQDSGDDAQLAEPEIKSDDEGGDVPPEDTEPSTDTTGDDASQDGAVAESVKTPEETKTDPGQSASAIDTPKTPDTGERTSSEHGETSFCSFWWPSFLSVASLTYAIWWIVPVSKKRKQ